MHPLAFNGDDFTHAASRPATASAPWPHIDPPPPSPILIHNQEEPQEAQE